MITVVLAIVVVVLHVVVVHIVVVIVDPTNLHTFVIWLKSGQEQPGY